MQVEANIQDHFWQVSNLKAVQGNPADVLPPVSEAEWHCWFQHWLDLLKPNLVEAPAYELSLRLTNDLDIQALNAQYRSQNQPTDVLAFATLDIDSPPLQELQWFQPLYLGDIVISVETATQQARNQGHPLRVELVWLATHGLLHLLGWDHPDEISLTQMLEQQRILLRSLELEIDL
ncbi:MAG: rRNA maturation RNase YbeY [Microcoleaceae cyanobacterium]